MSEAKSYNSRTADKFVVRLPEGMRERIADVARNYHRSMNSEIISRLEGSLLREIPSQKQPNQGEQAKKTDEAINAKISTSELDLLQIIRSLPEKKRDALSAFLDDFS